MKLKLRLYRGDHQYWHMEFDVKSLDEASAVYRILNSGELHDTINKLCFETDVHGLHLTDDQIKARRVYLVGFESLIS